MNKERENEFKEWMKTVTKSNGKPYGKATISSYITNARALRKKNYIDVSIFDVLNSSDLNNILDKLNKNNDYLTFNANRRQSPSAFLTLYQRFLSGEKGTLQIKNNQPVELNNNNNSCESRNLIFFGAPGTGKSFTLDKLKKDLLPEENIDSFYERVTFHPDYSYANFVGTYKPCPETNANKEKVITYKYIPGPFMRTYVKATKDPENNYLLIIEEINRADVAAVFGDVFQLLDRNDDNESEYTIEASEDIKDYLKTEKVINENEEFVKLSIPQNMYIWATMNSADQGVFPMDTAFKRRWDFEYLDIDAGENEIKNFTFTINGKTVCWNNLRKAINEKLLSFNINEDKLMGPFFISKSKLNEDDFINTFKNKVIMYLFEDAAKQKRQQLFKQEISKQYSKICLEFDKKGIEIFDDSILKSPLLNIQEEKIPVSNENNNQE